MKILFQAFLALFLFVGSFQSLSAQEMPPIPVDQQVRIGKLPNGLTYYIRHNELPKNQAEFYIAQKVGSILEEEEQRGLAHFLEHMCFNGTTNFPGKNIINYLEKIGVRFGENLNAYTSIDETVYNISNVPVADPSVVDTCLLILHDWANDLTLAPKEIDSERGVIREEWRTRSSAMLRMYEKVLPEMYPDSKYGHRLPIGLMSVVNNFKYQALRDYYEKWYRPDLQGIIVVGDVDVDQVEGKIQKIFSSIEMPQNPAKREYFQVADNLEPIITVASDKEQQVTLMNLWFKHDAAPVQARQTIDYMIIRYMQNMVGLMLNARLSEVKQQPDAPFMEANVECTDYLMAKTKEAFAGTVLCQDNGEEAAFKALLREMERVRRFGFTETEYERARASYLSVLEGAYNERSKTQNGEYVQELVDNFLYGEPIPGIENEYQLMSQIVPNLSVQSVNEVARNLITDDNLVVNLYYPEKEGLNYRSKTEVLAWIQEVKSEAITAYQDKVSDEPLIQNKPQGGKVVKTEPGAFGSQIWTLSNGVRVILKPTDFRKDAIHMNAFSAGGTSIYGTKYIAEQKTVNTVADLGGMGNFSVLDLEKVLAGKRVSVSSEISELTENFSGFCPPKDFETLMQLTYLKFTSPRADQQAFDSYKQRTKSFLSNMQANPMNALMDTVKQVLYGNSPLLARVTPQMIDQIDYQQCIEMYKDRFKDASDFTFIFVGNFQEEVIKPYIETYLGGLPNIGRKESFKDNGVQIIKGMRKKVFVKPLETPKATVVIAATGQMEYNLKNMLLMSLLEQSLNMVYTDEVREKEGATYGVNVSGGLTRYPKDDEATLQIYFDTDPAKSEKMTEIVLQQLELMAVNGPKAEHLDKTKEFMLKKHSTSLKNNGFWLNALYQQAWYHTDIVSHYEKVLNAITPADVKAFAQKLLNQKNRVEVTMTSSQN